MDPFHPVSIQYIQNAIIQGFGNLRQSLRDLPEELSFQFLYGKVGVLRHSEDLLSSVAKHRLKKASTLPSFSSGGVKDFKISSFAAFALFRLNPTTQAPYHKYSPIIKAGGGKRKGGDKSLPPFLQQPGPLPPVNGRDKRLHVPPLTV